MAYLADVLSATPSKAFTRQHSMSKNFFNFCSMLPDFATIAIASSAKIKFPISFFYSWNST